MSSSASTRAPHLSDPRRRGVPVVQRRRPVEGPGEAVGAARSPGARPLAVTPVRRRSAASSSASSRSQRSIRDRAAARSVSVIPRRRPSSSWPITSSSGVRRASSIIASKIGVLDRAALPVCGFTTATLSPPACPFPRRGGKHARGASGPRAGRERHVPPCQYGSARAAYPGAAPTVSPWGSDLRCSGRGFAPPTTV